MVINVQRRSAFVGCQYSPFTHDMISCLHQLVSRAFSEGFATSIKKKKNCLQQHV